MSTGELEAGRRQPAAAATPTVVVSSPWRIGWRRLRRDRVAMASGIFLILLVLAIFPGAKLASVALGHGPDDPYPYAVGNYTLRPVGPWSWVPDTHQLAPQTSDTVIAGPEQGTPNTIFVLGADGPLGHDLFLRLLYGGQVSLEVLDQDYVRTARAKGAPERRVLFKHALPNTVLPIVTMLAMDIGTAVGICVYIEAVFRMPGLGLTTLQSMGGLGLDLPMLIGITLFTGTMIIVLNLFVDLLAVIVDPRITQSPRAGRSFGLAARTT